VRPSKYPARSARARRGARAPPVVTAWWPRARRWASTAGGVQPGDEVRGIQWLQLTWEEGEMSGKDIRGGAHPSSGTSMERWSWAAQRGGIWRTDDGGGISGEIREGREGPGIRGRRADSRKDGGSGDVFERM
jgi:hypothetical protein